MSQTNVLQVIEKSKKGITTKQLSEKLGLGKSTINQSLRKLLKYKEVKREINYKGQWISYLYFVVTKHKPMKKQRYINPLFLK